MLKVLPFSAALGALVALFGPGAEAADERPVERVAGADAQERSSERTYPQPVPILDPEGAVAEPELAFPTIETWQAPLRRCGRRGRRRFCDGPRKVPAPYGEAAARAERLGLEGRASWDRLMGGPAPEEVLAEVPGEASGTLLWPVPEGFMGRGFGHVREGRLRHRLHRGVDIPAPLGSLVRAAHTGLVIFADNSVSGYGNLVVILHPDDTRTLYAHLSRAAVFAGQTVERGQVIGEIGRTGLTRAPHLHFEYRKRAVARNPRRRFVERPTFEEEKALMNAALRRRRAEEARLAELREAREARERRQRRRAR